MIVTKHRNGDVSVRLSPEEQEALRRGADKALLTGKDRWVRLLWKRLRWYGLEGKAWKPTAQNPLAGK